MADIELSALSNDEERSIRAGGHFSLPPTDRGKDAWLVLAACSMLEALIWGLCCFHYPNSRAKSTG